MNKDHSPAAVKASNRKEFWTKSRVGMVGLLAGTVIATGVGPAVNYVDDRIMYAAGWRDLTTNSIFVGQYPFDNKANQYTSDNPTTRAAFELYQEDKKEDTVWNLLAPIAAEASTEKEHVSTNEVILDFQEANPDIDLSKPQPIKQRLNVPAEYQKPAGRVYGDF